MVVDGGADRRGQIEAGDAGEGESQSGDWQNRRNVGRNDAADPAQASAPTARAAPCPNSASNGGASQTSASPSAVPSRIMGENRNWT